MCCCGKYDGLETFIVNGIQHEPFGPAGAMCAPTQACNLRDATAENEKLRKVLTEIRQGLASGDGDFVAQIDSLTSEALGE